MSNIPISVCIIAKDESNHIEECLKRLKPFGMEIIVTDTGSVDDTRDIAFRYADKVLEYEWINDFSEARNYCAMNASNDWILALDCDEYVESIDVPLLRKWIKAYPQNLGLLHLKSVVRQSTGEKGMVADDLRRLYNKKFYKFEGAIHEQIVPKYIKEQPCFMIPMEATHYGYCLTAEENAKKQERNLLILKSQLDTKGESPYLCYQIAQSEIVLENYEQAISYYEKALSFNPAREIAYVPSIIEGLAKAYVLTGRRGDALALMDRYENECEDFRYIFYHANVLMDNNEPLKALVKYVKVTTMPETDPISNEMLYSYKHIVELYHKFGEYDLAKFFEDKYEECLKARES